MARETDETINEAEDASIPKMDSRQSNEAVYLAANFSVSLVLTTRYVGLDPLVARNETCDQVTPEDGQCMPSTLAQTTN